MNTFPEATVSLTFTGQITIDRESLINLFGDALTESNNQQTTFRMPITYRSTKYGQRMPQMAYSMTEAADIFGVSRTTVWRWVKSGELRSSRLFCHTLISKTEIERVLNRKSC
jgi:excisionase family DNA binding protein